MEQLTIQQWFAKAVAAGLMSEWHGIKACKANITSPNNWWELHTNNNLIFMRLMYAPIRCERKDPIIINLRIDGKDLYSLEWRKPNEQDVGKMCWFLLPNLGIIQSIIADIKYLGKVKHYLTKNSVYCPYCLLADHGQIAPDEEAFKRAYGD